MYRINTIIRCDTLSSGLFAISITKRAFTSLKLVCNTQKLKINDNKLSIPVGNCVCVCCLFVLVREINNIISFLLVWCPFFIGNIYLDNYYCVSRCSLFAFVIVFLCFICDVRCRLTFAIWYHLINFNVKEGSLITNFHLLLKEVKEKVYFFFQFAVFIRMGRCVANCNLW